ncbi:MAG: double zinc ribbon domain-containing protein [Candidatus Heimdallarchaeaceae archaeon]
MIQKMCNRCGLLNKKEVSYCTHCGNKIDTPTEYTLLKQCPVCQKYVRNEALFCSKCGYNFANERNKKNKSSSQTKACPFCRSMQKIDAKFCTQCGARFTEKKSEPNILICSNCQTVNPPNARFCKYCGLKFDIHQKETSIKQEQKEEHFERKEKPSFKVVKCLNCDSSNHPDSNYCNQCGIQIRKKTVLCSICGQKIVNEESCPSCGRKLIRFEYLENDLLKFLPIEKAQFLTDFALSMRASNYFFDINLIKKELLEYLTFYPTILYIFSSKCSIDYLNSFKIGLEQQDKPEEKLDKIVRNFEVFLNRLEERIDLFAISTFAYFHALGKESKLNSKTRENLNFLLAKSVIAIDTELSDLTLKEKELVLLQINKLIIMLFKLQVSKEEEKRDFEKIIRGLLVALSMNIKDMNKSKDPKLSELSEKFYYYSVFFSEELIKNKISGDFDVEEVVVILQNLKSELVFSNQKNELLSICAETLSTNFLNGVITTLNQKKGFISNSLQNLTIESIQTCFDLKTVEKNDSALKKAFEDIICKNIFQFEKNRDLSTVIRNMLFLYTEEEKVYSILSNAYNKLSSNKETQKKFVTEILRSLSNISIQENLPWSVNLYERVKKEMKIKIVEELEKEKEQKSEPKIMTKVKKETRQEAKDTRKERISKKVVPSKEEIKEKKQQNNTKETEEVSVEEAKYIKEKKEKVETTLDQQKDDIVKKKDKEIEKKTIDTKKTKQKSKPKKELLLG